MGGSLVTDSDCLAARDRGHRESSRKCRPRSHRAVIFDGHVQAEMERAIDHFLDCTVQWTPRWFNKPKFHIIRHLPFHVRRFGPAILFATEAFESYNAVIREQSIHSNRHAPSRDIALGFSHTSRVRHFMSGGVFQARDVPAAERTSARRTGPARLQPLCRGPPHASSARWETVGPDALALARTGGTRVNFVAKQLGIEEPGEVVAGAYSSSCSYLPMRLTEWMAQALCDVMARRRLVGVVCRCLLTPRMYGHNQNVMSTSPAGLFSCAMGKKHTSPPGCSLARGTIPALPLS